MNTAEKTVRNTVKKTIRDNDLIPQGSTVILGLSGGPDSLCLLHILCSLRSESGFELYALHVNHMIRGEAADADEEFVRKYCEEQGIVCRTVRTDCVKFAEENGMTVEEAGRTIRQQALREYSKELGGALIALAHNRDDQAETVLMRIIRGTGIHGLSAMEYKRNDGVIRPLLDVPKAQIEEYCNLAGLRPRKDLTNDSCDYTRNKVRNVLLPQLREYNPGISDALVRLSRSAREDDEALAKLAEDFEAAKCRKTQEKSGILSEYSRKDLCSLESALLMRVLAISLKNAGLEQDVSSERLYEIRKVIAGGKGGLTVELPRGVRVRTAKGRVFIIPAEK